MQWHHSGSEQCSVKSEICSSMFNVCDAEWFNNYGLI
jgi:hypothetical protein